jgi:hypothetical protein
VRREQRQHIQGAAESVPEIATMDQIGSDALVEVSAKPKAGLDQSTGALSAEREVNCK